METYGLPTHINGKQYPYEIHNPMMTQFSIGRFSGGIKYNGVHYVWDQRTPDPHDAILVREDLFDARAKAHHEEAKEAKRKLKSQQQKLPI